MSTALTHRSSQSQAHVANTAAQAIRLLEVVLRLPEPLLARAREIPRGRGWTLEPKLDQTSQVLLT